MGALYYKTLDGTVVSVGGHPIPPVAILRKSANQSFTSGVETTITWNIYDFDSHSICTTNGIVIPAAYAGVWRFDWNITFGASDTGIVFCRLVKAGVQHNYNTSTGRTGEAAIGVGRIVQSTRVLKCAGGELVSVLAYTTGPLTVIGGNETTSFQATFVRPL